MPVFAGVEVLRYFVSPSKDNWELHLPCCDFAINNAGNAMQSTDSMLFAPWRASQEPSTMDIVCKL